MPDSRDSGKCEACARPVLLTLPDAVQWGLERIIMDNYDRVEVHWGYCDTERLLDSIDESPKLYVSQEKS